MPAKVLIVSGSVRSGSFNVALSQAANKVLAGMGAETTMISLHDYPLPLLDEDLRKDKGLPDNAIKLARQLAAHDGLFLASPEYNSSIPPLLKNTIDWISLVPRDIRPFAGLTVALGSASNGALGGVRGLYHLRSVVMNVGAQIVTEQVSISGAATAFGDDGLPTDDRQRQKLENACRSLLENLTEGRARP